MKEIRRKGCVDTSLGEDELTALFAAKVRLLYANAPVGMSATVIASSIVALLLWDVVSHVLLMIWVSSLLLLTAGRYILVSLFRKRASDVTDMRPWGRRFALGVACNGTLLGVGGVLLFPGDSVFHQAVLIFILGVLVGGAIAPYSVIMSTYALFLIPTIVPITARFLIHGGDFHIAVGLMSLTFTFILIGIAKQVSRTIGNALQTKLQNVSLIDTLAAEKGRIEALNRELTLEVAERRRAEEELSKTLETLESMVQERTEELARINDALVREIRERMQTLDALGKISEAAIEFVQLPPEADVYEFICTKLKDLVGNAIVVVNSYDEEHGTLSARKILGVDPSLLETARELLRAPLLDLSFKQIDKNIRTLLFSGKLNLVEEGLYGVFFHTVPYDVCRRLEAMADIREIYSIGFRREGTLFGNATILTRSDTRLNKDLIETFLGQASIVLERRRAEESLRESEARFRTIFHQSPAGIELYDSRGILIDANEACLDIFGVDSIEDVRGFDLFADPNIPDDIKDRLRNGDTVRREVHFDFEKVRRESLYKTSKSGQIFLQCLITPLKAGDGSLHGFLVHVLDITDRKRIEEEIFKAQKLESVGILAGGIAHDFNNILTAIWGNVNLARMYLKPGDKAYELLEQAEMASQRARDLSLQLLTFSKGGAPVRKPVSLPHLVHDAAALALSGSNVKCAFSLPDDLWSAEIDEGQMSQALHNLILNAVHAMPEGGTVEIAAENITVGTYDTLPVRPGKYLALSVRDHGIGIKEGNLSKIFDPYFTTKQRGTGLGLTVVYSIVKRHEGHVGVESKPGIGTTFTVYLPASDEQPAGRVRPQPDLVVSHGRILLMDDEEIVRNVAKDMLAYLGYEVECANDGEEAVEKYRLALASPRPFDTVIMDLTIPGGMGGREAVTRLLEIDPHVKAIVSSGYSTDPIMAEYRRYGFTAVIPKPFTIQGLSRVLQSLNEAPTKIPGA